MRNYGLELSEIEVTEMIKYFDTNNDGAIQFNELLKALRGSLNHARMIAVDTLFNKIDKASIGSVTLHELEKAYKAENHPDVQNGARTAEEVANEFSKSWETQKKDGLISKQEFFDFFTEVAAHVESDAEFVSMLK